MHFVVILLLGVDHLHIQPVVMIFIIDLIQSHIIQGGPRKN